MRWLKLLFLLAAVVALQTALFSRFRFFGAAPDLVLVAVIIAAVLDQGMTAVLFAAAAGLCQDVLSIGPYLNLLTKTLAAGAITLLRRSFLGDECSLIAGLVAALTPLLMLLELAGVPAAGRVAEPLPLAGRIALSTLYSLLLVPLLLPAARRVFRD